MGDDIYSHLIVPKWIDYAFDKSKNNTILEKFVFLWFAFNAYYGKYLRYELDEASGEEKLISEMRAIKDSMELRPEANFFVNKIKEIDCFKKIKEKNVKKMHPDYKRPKGSETEVVERYNKFEDVNSTNKQYCLNGYLRILYKVRCNLFHGTKYVYKDRDFGIIALATECLCWVLIYFSENYEITNSLKNHRNEWRGLAEREIAAYYERKKANKNQENEEI